ncbi:MAG TPA: hypothetical protein VMX55_04105 [candidate division Zixibacteria bacterium]|nr:hypothetical protein [candidate division Zixibacteria bacterium]
MPFANYPDWGSCVIDQMKKGKSKEVANKICGALKKKFENRERKKKVYEYEEFYHGKHEVVEL